jgi:phosphoenolpyruvate-protein kinase (PTS system EI component)
MVSTLEEVERAKQVIKNVQSELDANHIDYDPTTPIGIMIEVPSTVLIADQLAQQVDFFSIGTNDLTQYIMAADRGNALLHDLVNYFQPSVLRAIKHIIDAGHSANIPVSMCGEMAGDTLALPLLIAMGIDNLSMNPSSIPEVKDIIRTMSSVYSQEIVETILQAESVETIKSYLQKLANRASIKNQSS